MNRVVLMVEVDGDAMTAARRVESVLPDAVVFGEVDPIDAALLVVARDLLAA